jgi:hypothetical protein
MMHMLQAYFEAFLVFVTYIWMLHTLLWLACFKRMFQVFHMFADSCCNCFHLDVAKVDLDVAYVAMAIHAYFKHMFQVFHMFQTYIASVSCGYFKK